MRLLLLALATALLAGTPPRSVYTPLTEDACRTVSVDTETGDATQACPGVAGYTLLVHEADVRQSVDIVAPGGAVYPLDYWSVITSGFSSVGPRAEWRVAGRRARPVALIVRVNASEDPARPDRTTSYLAVARVSASGACVTDRIAPSADMNVRARRAADRASGRPCLTSPE